MKALTRLSKEAVEFCINNGFDVQKVKEAMKSNSFSFEKLESKEEMDYEGVDYSFPYVIKNSLNISIQ